MGFEVLTSILICGITFASLSGHLIMDKDTNNIGVHVHNRTELSNKEYKTWILRGNDNSKTNEFVSFKISGKTQYRLLCLHPSLC